MDLSVVVPCFNEESRLPPSLAGAIAYLEGCGRQHELIVVDDGSTDRTPELIHDAEGRHRAVRGVLLPSNRGKGRALAEGVAVSCGDLVLVSDADFSAPIDELPKLEAAIAAGADVAIGSRAKKGAREVDQPAHRRLMGKGFNLAVQALLLPGLWDTQCGFKLFRGQVARDLFSRLRTDGFAYDVEVLYEARRSGLEVTEVPVRWINSATTRVQAVRHSREMLLDLLRIRMGR
ncbi:MAG TPA: dolichyl-phosphate beta-glucosyltransferase [Candidatus Dormibacteraeota bacterium]|nr:dolichyl-phosphate beta-glucosyltransferase [Candidatus Dormibacteraeota bacterium]